MWRLEKGSPFLRREPDTFGYEDSIAISLRRIADSLERMENAKKPK